MKMDIPELSLVILIGNSGRGFDFAEKHFKKDEILCFNHFKDSAHGEEAKAFDALYLAVSKRLRAAKLTVINALGERLEDRKQLIRLAKKYHCFPTAIVFEPIQSEKQSADLLNKLEKEGFRYSYVLKNKEEADKAEVMRTKLYNNKRDIHGPFDIIGDVHGCYDELCELLEKLGYVVEREACRAYHPQGRTAVFVGDLVDRGPKIMEVLKLVMSMVKGKRAFCTLGNHDGKLQRKLNGAKVQVAYGLEKTLEQLEDETESFRIEVKAFLDRLISHYVFDDGRLVVAHAGLKERLHGRGSRKIRNIAMFGETTGKTDEFGLPIRLNWAKKYYGKAFVVYGHTPQEKVQMVNNTVNIDTGCVFGGKLTAIRYPEKQIVEVRAKTVYYEPSRPLAKA